MSKNSPVSPTQFINVLVSAVPEIDSKTHQVRYKTRFMPESIKIRLPDTVINYQLIDPTPGGVRFASVDVSPDNTQLSTPSIGRSGKVLTFSDANTHAETLSLTLHFIDADGIKFAVDPEVTNDPEPVFAPMAFAMAGDPEETNDPPPVK